MWGWQACTPWQGMRATASRSRRRRRASHPLQAALGGRHGQGQGVGAPHAGASADAGHADGILGPRRKRCEGMDGIGQQGRHDCLPSRGRSGDDVAGAGEARPRCAQHQGAGGSGGDRERCGQAPGPARGRHHAQAAGADDLQRPELQGKGRVHRRQEVQSGDSPAPQAGGTSVGVPHHHAGADRLDAPRLCLTTTTHPPAVLCLTCCLPQMRRGRLSTVWSRAWRRARSECTTATFTISLLAHALATTGRCSVVALAAKTRRPCRPHSGWNTWRVSCTRAPGRRALSGAAKAARCAAPNQAGA